VPPHVASRWPIEGVKTRLSVTIKAPIDDVFAFFDDPSNLLQFQEHAKGHFQRVEVVEVRPDGRRMWDVHMKAGPRTWVQTIDQTLREERVRQFAESWTWTKRRDQRWLTVTTDRHFSRAGEGTKLEMTTVYRLENPWRHPLAFLVNAVWGNSAGKLELEHALHYAIEHLERRDTSDDIQRR
jgi:uncharacterized protein YndB with AHSA1/START domain